MLTDDTPRGGLYILRFPNGTYYGGRSYHIQSRFYLHTSQLRRGTHGNPRMQRVFNKYGAPILEIVQWVSSKEERVLVEQMWLDEHVGGPQCLNLSRSAESNTMEGRHHSAETKIRIAESLKGRVFTEEHRGLLAESATGRKMSTDLAPAWEKRNKERVWTPEMREKSAKSHTGKKHTPETRARMAESALLREAHKRALSVAPLYGSQVQ